MVERCLCAQSAAERFWAQLTPAGGRGALSGAVTQGIPQVQPALSPLRFSRASMGAELGYSTHFTNEYRTLAQGHEVGCGRGLGQAVEQGFRHLL